jgi:LuxR family transcriptional regulator, quorum-sensing system regulator SolR
MMHPLLHRHGVTVFNYYRIYFDGGVIRFSSDEAWTKHFFKKDYLNQITIPQSYLLKPVSYFIWLTEDCPEILLDAAMNFNISNGITLAYRYEAYFEYFCFVSTSSNKSIINNFYLNNLDVLQNYSDYFREKADSLLQLGEKNKLILSNSFELSDSNSVLKPNNMPQPLIKLSKRQRDCAFLLLKGLHYKEIGMVLNLSHRTVETHLNHIKSKLFCGNKTELIIKLYNLIK